MELDAKAAAARSWFGYGRWDAPYWFVGKEPGGVDEPEQYASWMRLGGGELIDCREHDRDCAASPTEMEWHGQNAKLQPTWRPLIALLLAYLGETNYDIERVRRYQNELWGTLSGQTAVVELSGVAAPDTGSPEPLRLAHLADRITTLRTRIEEHKPKIVVFYGGHSYLGYWSEIAGVSLDMETIITREGTTYVATPHPTAHGLTNEFWTTLGHRIAIAEDSVT